MTAKKAPKRQIRIRAEYAAMLVPFISREETRYYLNGIHVEPHHKKGVLLIACDGHRMSIIHDADGETNGNWICPLPTLLRQVLRGRKPKASDNFGQLHFIDDAAYLTNEEFTGKAEKVSAHHLLAIAAPAIDGEFPDWRRVVPKTLPSGAAPWFNSDYLADFETITKRRLVKTITIHAGDDSSPAVVLVAHFPEFIGVQMPIRGDAEKIMPTWLDLTDIAAPAE